MKTKMGYSNPNQKTNVSSNSNMKTPSNEVSSMIFDQSNVQGFIHELEHPEVVQQHQQMIIQKKAQQELNVTEQKFQGYLKQREEERNKQLNIEDIQIADDSKENQKLMQLEMNIKNNPHLSLEAKRKRLLHLAQQEDQMTTNLILEKARNRLKPQFDNDRDRKFESKMKIFKNLNTFLEAKGFYQNLNDLNEEQRQNVKNTYQKLRVNEVFNTGKSTMQIFLNQPIVAGGISQINEEELEQFDEQMMTHLDLLQRCNHVMKKLNEKNLGIEGQILAQIVQFIQQKELIQRQILKNEKLDQDIAYSNPFKFYQFLNNILFPKQLSAVEEDLEKQRIQKAEFESQVNQNFGSVEEKIQNDEIKKLKDLIHTEKQQFEDELKRSMSQLQEIKDQVQFVSFQQKAKRILDILVKTSQNIYQKNILEIAGSQEFMKIAQSVKQKSEIQNQDFNTKLESYRNLQKYGKSEKRAQALEMYQKYKIVSSSPRSNGKDTHRLGKNLNLDVDKLQNTVSSSGLRSNSIQYQQASPMNSAKQTNSPIKIVTYRDQAQNASNKKMVQSASGVHRSDDTINGIDSKVISFIQSRNPSTNDLLNFLTDQKNKELQEHYLNQSHIKDEEERQRNQQTKHVFDLQFNHPSSPTGKHDSIPNSHQPSPKHMYTISPQNNYSVRTSVPSLPLISQNNKTISLMEITKNQSVSQSIESIHPNPAQESMYENSQIVVGSNYHLPQSIKNKKQQFVLQTESTYSNIKDIDLQTPAPQENNDMFFVTETQTRETSQSGNFNNLNNQILIVSQSEKQFQRSPNQKVTTQERKQSIKLSFAQQQSVELGTIIEELNEEKVNYKEVKKQLLNEISEVEHQFERAFDKFHQRDHLESLRFIGGSENTLQRYERSKIINQQMIRLVA